MRRRWSPAVPLVALAAAAPSLAAQDRLAAAPGAGVAGVVYDSLAGAPLAGATVQLGAPAEPGRILTTVTDSAGRYRFDGVRPGRWLVGFLHPVLDVLGIDPPTTAVALGGEVRADVDLAVPGAARVRAALCGPAAAGDSTGVVYGTVADAERGRPFATRA